MVKKVLFESEHYLVVKTKYKNQDKYEIRSKQDGYLIFDYTDEGLKRARDHAKWLEAIRPTFAH